MNIILTLTSILIFAFSLLPSQVHAAANTYYVTQNGNGARSGSSLPNAWSVSNFNSSANWSTTDHPNRIDPGDTVYFSGTITSQIILPESYGGSSGNYVTLDGWEGGTCDPVANEGCASAVVLDRPSRTNSVSNYCIYIKDNSYLIIQDFNMQDSRGGIYASGPKSGNRSTHLTIRRNYIHDMEGKGAQISGDIGINYVTFGGAEGDGNFVYECDEKAKTQYSDSHCVGFSNNDDMVISYNRIENDPATQNLDDASNVVSIHTSNRVLFEYNTVGYPHGQSCVAIKESGGTDKIFRFNKIYGCGQQAGFGVCTNQGPQTNYYIYGNLIYNSAGGIWLYRNYDDMHIWSNVIHNITPEGGNGQGGLPIEFGDGWTASKPTDQGDVYVYNNTISRGDLNGVRSYPGGLNVANLITANVRIKNNLFYYNNSNKNDIQVAIEPNGESDVSIIDYNTIYSSGTPYFYNNSARRTASYINSEYGVSNNKAADPGFTDPKGADNIHGTADDNYTLNGANINDGQNLSKCFSIIIQGYVHTICYDDALDPNNTDWSTTPPTVRTTKQINHGSWDRGAYVYTGDVLSSPPMSPPNDLKIITK